MTKNVPQKDYPTEKLAKVVLNWDDNSEEVERIEQVEISKQYPILIMVDEAGKIQWILDGNHRAQKALRSKAETIPAKLIKPSMLDAKSKRVLLGVVDENVLNESKYDTEETVQQTIDRLKARIKDPNDGGNVPFLVQKIKDLEKLLNKGEIEEAEYKGRDVDLNKPKRGGPKKFYVYVRDPKTKRIKKVTFGAAGGGQSLKVKLRDKKARNAFSKRHRCPEKKDRTKASYWSCNLPRYASMLGLGANMNTFW